MQSSCETDFLRWFIMGLGWIVAIFLAFFNNHKSDNRETRKEVKTQIDELKESSQKVVEAAKDYYLIENAPKSMSIIAVYEGLNHCGRIIDQLSKHNDSNLMPLLGTFFDSVTNDPFESNSFTPGQQHLERCKRISHDQMELTRQAEVWFGDTFQNSYATLKRLKKFLFNG